MKKIIKAFILLIILLLISHQLFYRIKHNSNNIITIGNQDVKMNKRMVLLIDNVKINEFNLRNHYSLIEKRSLSFGKNKLTIKGIDSDIEYNSIIYYYGLFKWNYIEFNNGKFYHDTSSLPMHLN